MTSSDIRLDERKLSECRALIRSSTFQDILLPMLLDEHPGRWLSENREMQTCFAIQREACGYEKAIQKLLSLLTDIPKRSRIESTYTPNIKEKK